MSRISQSKKPQRIQVSDKQYDLDSIFVSSDIQKVIDKLASFDQQAIKAFGPTAKAAIDLEFDSGYGYDRDREVINVRIYRDETPEEIKDRIATAKRKSASAKKAAVTRNSKREAEEKALLAKLKSKYEGNK